MRINILRPDLKNILPGLGLFIVLSLVSLSKVIGSEIYVGASSIDITPPLPVSLDGQMSLRIAEDVESPLYAGIIVLENVEGENRETSIWVSLDLVVVTDKLRDMIRSQVHKIVPEVDIHKMIINATHTHTGPSTREGNFILPEGVVSVEETLDFIAKKVSEGIKKAWDFRKPGSVTWGLGQAKIATNRRAVYYDGSARMYGKTNLPEFRGLEGYEDHDVNVLFFWNDEDQLIASCINVACPSQEVEGRSSINADFWHPVREKLKEKFGNELVVLGWVGAAGDQSPHLMYGQEGEERMLKLRDLGRLEELARRIVVEVEDIYEVVNGDKKKEVELIHEVRKISLPRRRVTVEAVKEAKAAISEIDALDEEARLVHYRKKIWNQALIDRYEAQQLNPDRSYDIEVHIIRLGDVVICTNPFELFTEYGIRIKARSKALQTFVVQLVGSGTYLPTMEAVRGGHYSAIIQSNEVGPEAGDALVEVTVKEINDLWKESPENKGN